MLLKQEEPTMQGVTVLQGLQFPMPLNPSLKKIYYWAAGEMVTYLPPVNVTVTGRVNNARGNNAARAAVPNAPKSKPKIMYCLQ